MHITTDMEKDPKKLISSRFNRIIREKKLYDLLRYSLSHFVLDKFLDIGSAFKQLQFFKKYKVFLFIMSCEKQRQRTEYLFDYYKNQGIDFVFYSDYNDLQKHVLKTSHFKRYTSNEIKHVNSLNFVANNLDLFDAWDYIFFIDDDTFVNLPALFQFIQDPKHNPNVVYGQQIDRERDPTNPIFKIYPKLAFLSGGAGNLFPKRIFKIKKRFKNFTLGFADVTLGLNLNPSLIAHSPLFKNDTRQRFGIEDSEMPKYVSFHYVKTKEQFDAYRTACQA
ncbi:MAG: hypothetical protein FJX89_09660 [Bacteroidetes bacterium]|nr:hypothetical protein [Bacteroidota bacterium]